LRMGRESFFELGNGGSVGGYEPVVKPFQS